MIQFFYSKKVFKIELYHSHRVIEHITYLYDVYIVLGSIDL